MSDSPVISGLNGDSGSYVEGASPTLLDSGTAAMVSDSDSADFDGGVVTASVTSGMLSTDVLSVRNQGTGAGQIGVSGSDVTFGGTVIGTLSGGTLGTPLAISLNAQATPANVGSLLQNLQFSNGAQLDPGSVARSIEVTVSDGDGGTSSAATVVVTVVGLNDAPTLSASPSNPTFTEGGSAVQLFSGASVSTVESGQTIIALTITVTNVLDGANESLAIDGTKVLLVNSGSITTNGVSYSVSVYSGTAAINLFIASGISPEIANTLVNGLRYANGSSNPTTSASRIVTLTAITDSGGTANGGTNSTTLSLASTVTIVGINNAPVLVATGGATAYIAGQAPKAIDGGITVNDVDSTTLAWATVAISGGFEPGVDSLALVNSGTMGNIVASYNAGTGVLVASSSGATATLAQWQAALRAVTYNNYSSAPDTTTRTISFQVSDGDLSSAMVTKSVTVSSPAPSIVSVTVPAADTYKSGDVLDFIVTFDQDVSVVGTPGLSLSVGSASVYADYVSGSGTKVLNFRRLVQAGELDTDGIELGALALQSGTINASTGGIAANLAYTPPSTAGILVDTRPLVVSLSPSNAATDVSPSATLGITFSESVTPASGKNIVVRRVADDKVVATIAADDSARVGVAGSVVAITLPGALLYNAAYEVDVDAGAFVSAGLESPAIDGATQWRFSTPTASTVTAADSDAFGYYFGNEDVGTINLNSGTTYSFSGASLSKALTINGNGATIQAGSGVTDTVVRSGTVGSVAFSLPDYANVKVFLSVRGALTLQNVTLQNNGADSLSNGLFAAINVKNYGLLYADHVTLSGFHNNPTPGDNQCFGVHAEPLAMLVTLTDCVFAASNAFRNAVAIRGGSVEITGCTFAGTQYPERLRNSDGYEYAIYLYGGNGTVSGNTISAYDSTNQPGYGSGAISLISFFSTSYLIADNVMSGNSVDISVTGQWSPYSTPAPTTDVDGVTLIDSEDAYTMGQGLGSANHTDSVSVMLDQNNEVLLTAADSSTYFAVLGGYSSPFLTTSGNAVVFPHDAEAVSMLQAATAIELETTVDEDKDWIAVAPTWTGIPTTVPVTVAVGHTYYFRAKVTHKSYVETSDPIERTLVTYSAPVTIAPTNNGGGGGGGRATPTITWPQPAPIAYGTPLSETQLNAQASVPGTFVYNPPAGTILEVGAQTLRTTFTPTNTAAYNTATASVSLTVDAAAMTAPLMTSPLSASGAIGRGFLYRITTRSPAERFGAAGLPAGLSLQADTGHISGIPTEAGTFRIDLTASNSAGSDSKTLVLTIAPELPVITSASAANARVGASFSYTIAATNSPTSFSASGLPAGLSVDASAGTISGTPTIAGNYSATLVATNAAGYGQQSLALYVDPAASAPTYSGGTSLSGVCGTALNVALAFEGATSYAVVALPDGTASALPEGVTLDPGTGALSGTPAQTGTFRFAVRATNASGSAVVVFTLTIDPSAQAPAITSAGTVSGRVGEAFSFQLQASPAATGFAASTLPSWLSLDTASGLLTGAPTEPTGVSLVVNASNAAGRGPDSALSVVVYPVASTPVIAGVAVARGRVGESFSFALSADNSPTAYGLVSGSLPGGLSLDQGTGAIAGTPTESGSFAVWVAASNANGRGQALELTLLIEPSVSVPVIVGNTGVSGQVGQAFLYVIDATNGPTAYSAAGLPAGLSLSSDTGAISGIPVAAGDYSVTLGAANAAGSAEPVVLALHLEAAPGTPVVTSASEVSGQVGQTFSYAIEATHAPSSFFAEGLPGGLRIDASTGVVSGEPTQAGFFEVSVGAGNASGEGENSTVLFAICAAEATPRITSAPAATGKVGEPFGYEAAAGPGTLLGYTLEGTLPSGLAFNTSSGVLAGTPSEPGLFHLTLGASSSNGTSASQELALWIVKADNVPVVTSSLYATAQVGGDFSYQIGATNLPASTPYRAPVSLDAVGLPSGLAVNPATGSIQGRPSAVGTYVVGLAGTNENGQGPVRTLTIEVLPAESAPQLPISSVARGRVGEAFSYAIRASGAPSSYETSGLPSWMSVDSRSGVLAGVPTAAGTTVLSLSARSAYGASAPAALTVVIDPAVGTPVITSSRTVFAELGQSFSYKITATDDPTSYVVTGLPAGLSLDTSTGTISGTPTASGSFTATMLVENAEGSSPPTSLFFEIQPSRSLIAR